MQGLKWRGRTGSWPRSIGSVFVRKVSPSTLLPRLASNSRPVFAGSRQARSHSTPRAWRTFDRLCSIRRRFHSLRRYTMFIFTFRTYCVKFKQGKGGHNHSFPPCNSIWIRNRASQLPARGFFFGKNSRTRNSFTKREIKNIHTERSFCKFPFSYIYIYI